MRFVQRQLSSWLSACEFSWGLLIFNSIGRLVCKTFCIKYSICSKLCCLSLSSNKRLVTNVINLRSSRDSNLFILILNLGFFFAILRKPTICLCTNFDKFWYFLELCLLNKFTNIKRNLNKHNRFFLRLRLNLNFNIFRRCFLYLLIWSLLDRGYTNWLDWLIWLWLRLILFYSWSTYLNIWISWNLVMLWYIVACVFASLLLLNDWHSILSLRLCLFYWNWVFAYGFLRLDFGFCNLFLWFLFYWLINLFSIFMNCFTFSVLFFKGLNCFSSFFFRYLTFHMCLMLWNKLFILLGFCRSFLSLWMLN